MKKTTKKKIKTVKKSARTSKKAARGCGICGKAGVNRRTHPGH